MKYLQTQEAFLGDAECSQDAIQPTEHKEVQLKEVQARLETAAGAERTPLLLEAGYLLLDLERPQEAHDLTWEAFDLARADESWEEAVQACDILFQAEGEDAGKALAHGIWLGVTYPIDPELSVLMLQHLADELPGRNDGAAVAAATAHYLVDMRAEGGQRDELSFFTTQLLGEVARRHSQVEEQEIFDFWVEQLELNNPEKLLQRLAKILDVLVADGQWWLDRDALRAKIPEA